MKDIERILATIGFSKYSEGIISYAAQLAERLNCRLIIANVVNIRDVQAVSGIESMGYNVDPEEYRDVVIKERTALLEEMLARASVDREKVKMVFRVGHPVDKLLEIIEEEKIDMVVMGPKGRTDFEQVLVGSVAEKMFRHCPVPLLSYRKI